MFSVVTFARTVHEVLRPDEGGITRGRGSDVNLLRFAALDSEFWFLGIRQDVKDIDESPCFLLLREALAILPCE